MLGLVLAYKGHQPTRPTNTGSLVLNDKVTVGPITVTQVDRAAELTRLDDEIVQLQAQVSSLINAAERLEAQQRIVLVLAQNITW